MPTIKQMKQRDRKEAELDVNAQSISLTEMNAVQVKQNFKEKLEAYQKWKKDNNIDGIKY